MWFTYHKTHYFKYTIHWFFSESTELYNQPHNQLCNISILPLKKRGPVYSPSSSLPQLHPCSSQPLLHFLYGFTYSGHFIEMKP